MKKVKKSIESEAELKYICLIVVAIFFWVGEITSCPVVDGWSTSPDPQAVGEEVEAELTITADGADCQEMGYFEIACDGQVGYNSGEGTFSGAFVFDTPGKRKWTFSGEWRDGGNPSPCPVYTNFLGTTESPEFTIAGVESITGLSNLYCTHANCFTTVTAVLTNGVELPTGMTITWGGDATVSNISGRTAKANFAGHAGKNKKVTAKLGTQNPPCSSIAYTVVDHTPVAAPVTVVTYNFVNVDPGRNWGVTRRGIPVSDITAFFAHPAHVWNCKVTTATCEIGQGSHLLPGVSEANVAAATTETIYRKMRADLISGGNLPCSWFMITAVQAHETVHSNAWQAINNPLFTTFRTTIEALNVTYTDTSCETPAQARTAIKGLVSYATADGVYVDNGITAWGESPPQHPGSSAATNAAEVAVTTPMVNALDAHAATKTPPWTR